MVYSQKMTATRDLILKELLNRQRCTINDLADAVQINPISVRHHVSRLEAENLVASENERHGVGRPRRVYFLTDEGMEKFPRRYLNLSMRLVESLKESLSPEAVNRLFRDIASGLVRDVIDPASLKKLTIAQRLNLVQEALSAQGFTIEIQESAGQVSIRETSCPYIHVGQEHPEVCIVDQTFIATVLATEVHKTHCVLSGDAYCAYTTPTIALEKIQSMENA